MKSAAIEYIQAVYEDTRDKFDLGKFGFEFSLGEIELYAMQLEPELFADYEQELREQHAEWRNRRAA